MKKIGLYSFVFLFLLTFSAKSQFWFLGQTNKKAKVLAPFKAYSSVSFGAGSANYWGEIVPISTFTTLATQTTRWNAGFQYTRHFSRKFSAKGSISYIRIAGDDNYFDYTAPGGPFDANFVRNLHFRNDLKEISLSGIWEINSNFENPDRRPNWAPYFSLGLAGLLHSPQARKAATALDALGNPLIPPVQNDWVNLRETNTEGISYNAMAISIPLGFGIRKRITKNIDIGFEVSYRISMTDYLDDVSDNRAINRSGSPFWNRGQMPGVTPKDEIFAANTMKALPSILTFVPVNILSETPGADQYFTTQIQFIYHIKNKIDCPPLPR
jgi:hypothetical protein